MTDNTQFKEDTTKLYNLLSSYIRKYHFVEKSKNNTPLTDAKGHLRTMLEIVRSDEENKEQYTQDRYC